MEPYTKNNLNDITYISERSPILTRKRGDNSQTASPTTYGT
jgi:hypothetical protein